LLQGRNSAGNVGLNIALVSDCYYPTKNGVTGVVALLKKGLEERGHRVLLIAPSSGSSRPAADGFPPVDVALPSFPLIPSVDFRLVLTSRQKLAGLFLKEGIEIVHTHTEGPAGCAARAAALMLGIPMVHTLHTLYYHYLHYLPFWLSKLPFMRSLTDQAMGRFLSPFKAVIAPSATAQKYISHVAPSVQVRLLPNARFPAADLAAGAGADVDAEPGPGRKSKGFMILVVGRLAREKRSRELFDAFTPHLAGRREITLLFAGGGRQLASLRRKAEASGLGEQILLPGYLPHREVLSLYKKADLFLSFSLSENHPLSFLEAAAAKLPLAVRGCPAYEGFVEDGVSGIVAGSDKELAERAVMLVGEEEKLQTLGDGAAMLSVRFSGDLHLERTGLLYDELRLDSGPIHG
jgi:1,2-diacylglycerol 3-alpha-glucosyltransferase